MDAGLERWCGFRIFRCRGASFNSDPLGTHAQAGQAEISNSADDKQCSKLDGTQAVRTFCCARRDSWLPFAYRCWNLEDPAWNRKSRKPDRDQDQQGKWPELIGVCFAFNEPFLRSLHVLENCELGEKIEFKARRCPLIEAESKKAGCRSHLTGAANLTLPLQPCLILASMDLLGSTRWQAQGRHIVQ